MISMYFATLPPPPAELSDRLLLRTTLPPLPPPKRKGKPCLARVLEWLRFFYVDCEKMEIAKGGRLPPSSPPRAAAAATATLVRPPSARVRDEWPSRRRSPAICRGRAFPSELSPNRNELNP